MTGLGLDKIFSNTPPSDAAEAAISKRLAADSQNPKKGYSLKNKAKSARLAGLAGLAGGSQNPEKDNALSVFSELVTTCGLDIGVSIESSEALAGIDDDTRRIVDNDIRSDILAAWAADTAYRIAIRKGKADLVPVTVCKKCGPLYFPVNSEACPLLVQNDAGQLVRCNTPFPTEPPIVTCKTCKHFTPDKLNPSAGIGECGKGHAPTPLCYPDASRTCDDWLGEST